MGKHRSFDVKKARVIDVDALKDWLKTIPLKDLSDGLGLCRVIMEEDFKRCIKNMPKGCIIETDRCGKWEVCSDEYEICASEFVCSECKESFCTSELTDDQFFAMMKYCPNCGSKMN